MENIEEIEAELEAMPSDEATDCDIPSQIPVPDIEED